MIKRKIEKPWFPWWINKWLWGSMRIEFSIQERAIWVDLLSIAGLDDGFIRANEDTAYPISQLAGMLIIPETMLEKAIEKFIQKGKITRDPKTHILRIAKWDKYQLSEAYDRVQKHRGSKQKKDTKAKKRYSVTEKRYNETNNNKDNKINNKIKDKKKNKEKKEKTSLLKKISNIDKELTQLLIDYMFQNDPNSSIIKRLTEKRKLDWMNSCRKLREIDKRPPELIGEIIAFCQKDPFWKSNILSMTKLRQKFDQLFLKAKKEKYAGIKEWLNEPK